MKEKFIEFIKNYFTEKEWSDFYQSLFEGWLPTNCRVYEVLVDNNYIVSVADHRGGEGKGDVYWSVFSVTHFDDVCYFKIDGWYASHYGAETSDGDYDFYEVKKTPVQTYEWRKE